MPIKKYSHKENRPTFKTKLEAERHGFIQYGRKSTKGKFKGGKKFKVYKVKGGWNVTKRK